MGYVKADDLQTIALPSDSNYFVKINTSFTYGEIKTIGTDVEGTKASDKYLSLAIKEWNLDDNDGNILDITQENIDKLQQEDVLAIISSINGEAGDNSEKKPETENFTK